MFDGEPEKRRLRDSIGFKMIAVGGLVVLMLIPLGMVGSLIGERESRQTAAETQVAATWGKSQLLSGPVLTVPYRQYWKDEKGNEQDLRLLRPLPPHGAQGRGEGPPREAAPGDLRDRGLPGRPALDGLVPAAELRLVAGPGRRTSSGTRPT